MRPAVVTAVLLVVCIQVTVTDQHNPGPGGPGGPGPGGPGGPGPGGLGGPGPFCSRHPAEPCGDGWSRIDDNRCVKFMGTPKTFDDAQEHCRTLNSDLVSVHSDNEMMFLTCLTWDELSNYEKQFWIGAKASGEGFRNTDGSEFDYTMWARWEPNNADGQEHCIETNANGWGYWNDVRCSVEKYFACSKRM